ncbi:hypothetical protein [Synechococcus sp. 1G10]|uniref:hypothetical protein n=1 Tax=Synechococcus sp. 1G10 TaxID=2025605 RepID=UPI000B980D3C|nr:hypothetical protein [Synechococcus sp. 1G10]
MIITRYHDPTEVDLINPYAEPTELEIICHRYLGGESVGDLAAAYGVRAAVMGSRIVGAGISGANTCKSDNMQHVIDRTGRFRVSAECKTYLYLFKLKRYSDTHCKVGISIDPSIRATNAQGEYGDERLRIAFATRRDAFLLEQAVLEATRGGTQYPADMAHWVGLSEIRTMPAEDMVPIIEELHNDLQALGPWEFAVRHMRMWPSQLVICQQKAAMATKP